MTTALVSPRAAPDPEERLDQLLADLGTRNEGLSSREAARRLTQHGFNEVVGRERHSSLQALIRQSPIRWLCCSGRRACWRAWPASPCWLSPSSW
jgi:Cation transporter/ATPase, N-terminus